MRSEEMILLYGADAVDRYESSRFWRDSIRSVPERR